MKQIDIKNEEQMKYIIIGTFRNIQQGFLEIRDFLKAHNASDEMLDFVGSRYFTCCNLLLRFTQKYSNEYDKFEVEKILDVARILHKNGYFDFLEHAATNLDEASRPSTDRLDSFLKSILKDKNNE